MVSSPGMPWSRMRIYHVNETVKMRRNPGKPTEEPTMQRHQHLHVPLINPRESMHIKNR